MGISDSIVAADNPSDFLDEINLFHASAFQFHPDQRAIYDHEDPQEIKLRWCILRDLISEKYDVDTANDALRGQYEKYHKWLWLGRHLYVKQEIYNTKGEEMPPKALDLEKSIVEEYGDDQEFVIRMTDYYKPSPSENNHHWKIITNNVGVLSELLYGEWNTDT